MANHFANRGPQDLPEVDQAPQSPLSSQVPPMAPEPDTSVDAGYQDRQAFETVAQPDQQSFEPAQQQATQVDLGGLLLGRLKGLLVRLGDRLEGLPVLIPGVDARVGLWGHGRNLRGQGRLRRLVDLGQVLRAPVGEVVCHKSSFGAFRVQIRCKF